MSIGLGSPGIVVVESKSNLSLLAISGYKSLYFLENYTEWHNWVDSDARSKVEAAL